MSTTVPTGRGDRACPSATRERLGAPRGTRGARGARASRRRGRVELGEEAELADVDADRRHSRTGGEPARDVEERPVAADREDEVAAGRVDLAVARQVERDPDAASLEGPRELAGELVRLGLVLA